MKTLYILFSILFSTVAFAANDEELTVELDGFVIEVLDFEDGDKLKLFEAESGEHILSKSYASVDLSQLPVGSYVLENNSGQSVYIDRLEEGLVIDGAFVVEGGMDIVYGDDSMIDDMQEEAYDTGSDIAQLHNQSKRNLLKIERKGDVITALDFDEGDKLKLFEVKDTIHILTKTSNSIDLGLLPVGVYLLENNKGESVIVEKFTEIQNNLTDM